MVLVRFKRDTIERLTGMDISEFLEIPWKLGGESRLENGEFVVEFNPDRPDLYSLWGLTRAIKIFKGVEKYREIKINHGPYELKNNGPDYRPYILSAIVKGSEAGHFLDELIDYQEKLHTTLGRNRRIAAIGLHDLDKVKFPLIYTSVRRDHNFIPLGEKKEISLNDFLNQHEKAKEYGSLVKENLPAILDSSGNIISLPPILNSEITSLSDDTKNFFIDVTGTDLSTIERILNLLVTTISYPEGKVIAVNVNGTEYPIFHRRSWKIQKDEVKEISGMDIKEEKIKEYLIKMGYEINGEVAISPEYRIDIFTDVDFIEDILKGMGFENIRERDEEFLTVGSTHRLRQMENDIRHLMVGYGFTEVVNFAMINGSFNKIFGFSDEYVKILNPVTIEQDVIRPRITLSLIQTLLNNYRNPYPQRIFEIGTVIRKGKQFSSLGIATCHKSASFSEIKGIFVGLLEDLNLSYEWDKFVHPLFVEGRAATIKINNVEIGFLGEVDPRILKQIGLKMPLSLGEIDFIGDML